MKVIFTALMNFLIAVCNIFLYPVNTIISTYFPDVSTLISKFTLLVNTYVGSGVAYFFAILPPYTKTLVLFYVSLLIAFYSISFLVHGVIKIIEIIKNLKIW